MFVVVLSCVAWREAVWS